MLKDSKLENAITINWIEDKIKSHAKLIPTLKMYPNDIIITADDDLEYYPDYVKDLLNKHKEFPNCIIANVCWALTDDYSRLCDGNYGTFVKNKPLNSALFYTGFGILCPPHCFNDKVFDKELFMKEFPTTDDIWFSFCAIINNTKIVRVFDRKDYENKLINCMKKYEFKNIPALYSVNKNYTDPTGNNNKNLRKIRKMFEKMNIKVDYIKVNNNKPASVMAPVQTSKKPAKPAPAKAPIQAANVPVKPAPVKTPAKPAPVKTPAKPDPAKTPAKPASRRRRFLRKMRSTPRKSSVPQRTRPVPKKPAPPKGKAA